MKFNAFMKNLTSKMVCKKGESHLIAILAMCLIIIVIASVIIMPRMKKTAEKQFDKTDQELEEMWDYK